MAKNKSLQRRVAEHIAKADAIKVKSAQRRIQRAAKANKPIKAPESLSSYYRKLFREVVKEKKEKAAPAPEPIREPDRQRFDDYFEQPDRADFDFDGVELFKMDAKVELGSSGSKDIRDRTIKHLITADEANRILNAPTAEKAAREFSKIVGYVAEVRDFRNFEFRGKTFDKDFFE